MFVGATRWWVLSAVLWVGCKDTRPTPERFCVDYLQALVDFQVRCGTYSTESGEDWRYQTSKLQCRVDPKLTFDRDRAQACLASFTTRHCSAYEFPCPDFPFVGTLALGASCFDGQCAEGLYCDVRASCPGQCAARIAVGEPAVGPCEGQAWPLEGVCAAPRALGESCAVVTTERPQCEPGTVCGGNDLCVALTSADAGQYCSQREGVICEEGLQCVGDGCEPWAKAGEACSAQRSCQWDLLCSSQSTCLGPAGLNGSCSDNTECRAHLFCGEGTCRVRPELGSPCFPGGFQCEAGLVCPEEASGQQFGTCQAPLRRGEPCTAPLGEDPCADGLVCGVNGCADQLPGGSKCRVSRQCQSQRCELDGGCAPACVPPVP